VRTTTTAKIAMIAITTKSSIRVKEERGDREVRMKDMDIGKL
jgi:hypothetical protein